MFTLRRLSIIPRSLPKLVPLCKPITRIIPSLRLVFPTFSPVRHIRTTCKKNQSRLVKLQIQNYERKALNHERNEKFIIMFLVTFIFLCICYWISFIIKLVGETL